jgi:hypothetical protein
LFDRLAAGAAARAAALIAAPNSLLINQTLGGVHNSLLINHTLVGDWLCNRSAGRSQP